MFLCRLQAGRRRLWHTTVGRQGTARHSLTFSSMRFLQRAAWSRHRGALGATGLPRGGSKRLESFTRLRCASSASLNGASETFFTLQDIAFANERYKDSIIIDKTPTKGWGVFAMRDFEPGDVVLRSTAVQVFSEPNSHTIQTDWNTHVIMDLPALLLNHVCNSSNLVVRPNEYGAYDFVARTRIAGGRDDRMELLFDYATTEYLLQTGFDCHCGDVHCRRKLRGFRDHREQIIQVYGKTGVAPYLLEEEANGSSCKLDDHDAALHG